MPAKRGKPDPLGLAVAEAAQEAAHPAVVILFGSRARGDHRENSDVDLLVISDGEDARKGYFAASSGVRAYRKRTGFNLHYDIIPMTRREFNRNRLAKQHVAGQADTYGVVMNDDPLEPDSEREDNYPDHWPETVRRIQAAERWLQTYNENIASDNWHQEEMGFAAQQAVENALKGWLSCLNRTSTYSHILRDLWYELEILGQLYREETSEITETGWRLFIHTEYRDPVNPDESRDWLTHYAALYRYAGTAHRMTREEKLELHRLVNPFVAALLDHIYRLSGTDATDVYPDGLRPWETHRPNP